MTEHDSFRLYRRDRGASIAIIVCLGLLLVPAVTVGTGSGIVTTPSDVQHSTQSAPATNSTHTLVITASNGTGRYIVTATGTTRVRQKEAADVHQPPVLQGSVGQGDRRDVITYTGHITSFKHRGGLQITLNGRSVSADALNGNYITISTMSKTKTRYRLIASGTIVPGGDADSSDGGAPNRSRVMGHVSPTDSTDSFYYTGQLDSVAASNKLAITVNGQSISMHKKGTTPTARPNGPNGPTDTQATPTADAPTPGPDTTARDQGSEPSAQPSQSIPEKSRETAQPTGDDGLSLLELIGGVIGMLVVAIIGLLALSN